MNGNDHAAGFEQLARQYWNALGNLAQPPQPAAPQMPGWADALAWWTQLAGRATQPHAATQPFAPATGQIDAAMERMRSQAGDWFGLMQQMAAGFAGRDAGAEQIANAWQQALGGAAGPNGVADIFRRMTGPGAQGFEHWLAQIAPWLQSLQSMQSTAPDAMREQLGTMLRLPTFGVAREHQERWQALFRAVLDYQQADAAFSEQLLETGRRAFARFEAKLEERSEPGRQLDSARALFDLWIDAAEEAWAEIALTTGFRTAYGRVANAQMRLRGAVQGEIEQIAGQLGLPTRTEMDASHRKVAALERELRALKRTLENAASQTAAAPAPQREPRRATQAATSAPSPDDAIPDAIEPPREVPARRAATRGTKAKASRTKATSSAATRSRMKVLPTVAAPRAIERGGARRDDAGATKKKKAR